MRSPAVFVAAAMLLCVSACGGAQDTDRPGSTPSQKLVVSDEVTCAQILGTEPTAMANAGGIVRDYARDGRVDDSTPVQVMAALKDLRDLQSRASSNLAPALGVYIDDVDQIAGAMGTKRSVDVNTTMMQAAGLQVVTICKRYLN